MDPSPPFPPPLKPDSALPEFTTPSGSASGLGASIPKTISLQKYNELVACFNQLQEALVKVRKRKDHYKNESVSLSGSLFHNVGDFKRANNIIKELEEECNQIIPYIVQM